MNYLRKIYYKFKIDVIWHRFASLITRLVWRPLHIMSAEETLAYILEHNCSVARFGDGELHIVAYGCALKFQRADARLQARLKQVLKSNNPDLLLCLPNRLNITKKVERQRLSAFWQKSLKQHLYAWTRHLQKDRLYGDTNMSRLTETAFRGEKGPIDQFKEIWAKRNVIIVEGEKTRFGVGNDLLNGTASVKRILGPAKSAFDCYEALLEAVRKTAHQQDNPLVLIALGPTATVLASDLADEGIQAIDIGHLDISYERMRTGCTGAIAGKYTNESDGGDFVGDCTDGTYLSQITASIPGCWDK